MQTFHYFPPGNEEQRTFLIQLLATLLSLALIAYLWWRIKDPAEHAILVGATLGVLWLLARTAWALEKKAQRSERAAIELDDAGLHITDPSGKIQDVGWDEIKEVQVIGGRLTISWTNGQFAVGAREIENGMHLVREVVKRHERQQSSNGAPTLGSFIPLEPK